MSTNSPDDDLIAEFMHEFDAAADKPAVIERFSQAHPYLATAFRDYVSTRGLVQEGAQAPDPDLHLLKPGDMLGDFRVVRFVARGGMGEIYEAEQLRLEKRKVALKVIRRGKAIPEAKARFEREQKVLATLHQTNIVPVYASGEKGEVQYFAMPFIDGATLGHVVQFLKKRNRGSNGSSQTPSLAKLVESAAGSKGDPVGTTVSAAPADPEPAASGATHVLTNDYLRSVAASLADVADALDAAHKANVLHRDIKPSNLMAERSGKCWVIDFGLAALVGQVSNLSPAPVGQVSNLSHDLALTNTGSLLGTIAYMAPEQFGGTPDRRADIWALGVTMYELLTLRRPFDGPHDELVNQIKTAEPRSPRQITPAVPNDLDAICRKAMRKSPADRYDTASAFAADLRHWMNNEPTKANPPWAGRRMAMWAKREPGWAMMVVMACVAAVGIGGIWIESERKARKATEDLLQVESNAAAEKERLHARQMAMLDFQKEHLSPHTAGWRDRLWAKGTELAKGGQEPELRDRMAAILSGLDAKQVQNFNEGAATFLAFDPTGNRLLMGGYIDRNKKDGKDESQPTRVRDLKTGEIRRSTKSEVGPVGWRGDVPVQLLPPTKERTSFLLWNVDLNQPIEEFALPPDHRAALADEIEGMNIAGVVLSADAKHVAALVRGPKDERIIQVWKTGMRGPWKDVPIQARQEIGYTEALALSAEGSLLALGVFGGQIMVWHLNAADLNPLDTFEIGHAPITALAFGRHRYFDDPARQKADGSAGWLLGIGDAGGAVAARQLDHRDRMMVSRNSQHEVFGLVFSPDGLSIISTGRTETRCWDVGSGRQELAISITEPIRNWLPGIALTQNGRQLAVASIPLFNVVGSVDLIELEPGRGIQVLHGLTGQSRLVTITPDGLRAAGLTQGWQAGVWDVTTGQLLVRVDAPIAMYAGHNSIRLSDDGRFLIVAGEKTVERWELSNTLGNLPRKSDSWELPAGLVSRLAIAADGKLLVCRNERTNESSFRLPRCNPPDDRCVRIYELQPGGKKQVIARHDDHAHRVVEIHAVPDGSCFIVDGCKTDAMNSRTIIAYAGQANETLWTIQFPNAQFQGGSVIDSVGSMLHFGEGSENTLKRAIPWRGESDMPVDESNEPALGRQIVFKHYVSDHIKGLNLAVPEAEYHFLTLDPDETTTANNKGFTSNGRFLIYGNDSGTFRVADLQSIRGRLISAGFVGW